MVDRAHGNIATGVRPGNVIVQVDPRNFRPTEVETLLGDASKAREMLGWIPEISPRGLTPIVRTRAELDLLNQAALRTIFQRHQLDAVILAAAKVGGIRANNTQPTDFIGQNLLSECNVIHQAFLADVGILLLLGSSYIYPRVAAQPMPEDMPLTGPLEGDQRALCNRQDRRD